MDDWINWFEPIQLTVDGVVSGLVPEYVGELALDSPYPCIVSVNEKLYRVDLRGKVYGCPRWRVRNYPPPMQES